MLDLLDIQALNDKKLQDQLASINSAIALHSAEVQVEIFQVAKALASGQDLTAAQKATFCTYWPIINSILSFLSQILTLFAFAKTWGPYIALLQTFAGQFCNPVPPVPPVPPLP
jgi:hypothetical protein